jgi:hypothetical protein
MHDLMERALPCEIKLFSNHLIVEAKCVKLIDINNCIKTADFDRCSWKTKPSQILVSHVKSLELVNHWEHSFHLFGD